MKRDINVNLEFGNKELVITAIERLHDGKYVEVYSNFSNFDDTEGFIKNCVKTIEQRFGAKIQVVSVILGQSKKVGHKIEFEEKEIRLSASVVTKSDVDTLLDVIEQKHNTTEAFVTLVQPFSYYVTTKNGLQPKRYNKAPIGVEGHQLKLYATVTTINRLEVYNYVRGLLQPLNLSIGQILLSSQAEVFNAISDSVLQTGGILLRIGKSRSTISFVKNYAIFKSINLTSYGMNSIYEHIAHTYDLKVSQAKQSVLTYGSFVKNESHRVISLKKTSDQKDISLSNFVINDLLTKLIELIVLKANKEISASFESIENIPFVLTGEVTKVNGYEDFVKSLVDSQYISSYHPLNYIENNGRSLRALGVSKFNAHLKDSNFSSVDTIVDTNPDSLKMLFEPGSKKTRVKQTMLKKLLNNLGEKHGYK